MAKRLWEGWGLADLCYLGASEAQLVEWLVLTAALEGVSLCLVGLPDPQLCRSGTQTQAPGFIQH